MDKYTLVSVAWRRADCLGEVLEYAVGWFEKYEDGNFIIGYSSDNEDELFFIPESLIIKITTIQEAEKCPFQKA